MIDIKKASQEFDKYARNYDLTLETLKMKYHHTYRVMKISEDIAKSLNLSEEDIQLAKLIGLLHDIARFEQYTRFKTLADSISIDHGDLGVEILTTNNYIRKFVQDDKYDNIILKAIENHNKYKIEDGLTERELLFAKIIKDADKLDIFFETLNYFYKTESSIKEIEEGQVNAEIMEEINQKILVKRKPNATAIDRLIVNLAFVFDYYIKYSFEVMKREDYVNKIIDKFEFKNQETKEKMEEIRTILNQFIEEKIEDDKI